MANINYINIDSIHPKAYFGLYEAASEERRKKADKYIKREDAVMCVLSEAMFRYALYKTGRSTKLVAQRDKNGKPYVQGEAFKFNISYAGKYVAVGYGETEIGIDVERVFIDSGRELVAKYCYTEEENSEIFKDGIEENNAMQFTQIWTMKESYLKYLGTEKNRPLVSFTADRANGTVKEIDGTVIAGIGLHSEFPDAEHCISVCSEDGDVVFEEISLGELLKALGIR